MSTAATAPKVSGSAGLTPYNRLAITRVTANCIGGSAILYAIAALAYSQALFIAASAVLLIGSGALGMVVLRESVEDWEHTPEFRGFPA